MTAKDDIAELQRKAAALDARRSAYLAGMASDPKRFDYQGLRDISQLSVRAASEIARLRGPAGRGFGV